MAWDAFLLMLVAFYATLKLGLLAQRQQSLKYLAFAITAFCFFATQLALVVEGLVSASGLTIYAEEIVEWGNVAAVAFVLSGLAILIRESKPVFAQFPLIYTALPLLIILSYILIKDTLAIKEWLLLIYQGGALTVALLMYAVYTYRSFDYVFLLTASGVFTITYIIYWFVPRIQQDFSWIWQFFLALGMLTAVYGINQVKHMNRQPGTLQQNQSLDT